MKKVDYNHEPVMTHRVMLQCCSDQVRAAALQTADMTHLVTKTLPSSH